MPAVLGGNQLVDGGVDRSVLPADAGAREEPEEHEDRIGERERGQGVRDQVEAERGDEEPAAAEPVGEVAEEQRPRDLADQVHRGRRPHFDAAQVQGMLAL